MRDGIILSGDIISGPLSVEAMGKARLSSGFRALLVAAIQTIFVQLMTVPAWPADTAKAGSNLAVNPKLERNLPPPGWIADHHDTWPQEHPVYLEVCREPAVVDEIRFMNRIIGHDEHLIEVTQSYLDDMAKAHGDAATRRVELAMATLENLRGDIAAAENLARWLQGLPACPAPASVTAASGGSAESVQAPSPAAGSTEASGREAPSTPLATEAAPAGAASLPGPNMPDRLVIRFDDRVAALTPAGIRAFDQAVGAIRGGKTVQLAIGGCDVGADYSGGSLCARRLLSLKELLAQNGVRDTKRLLAGIR
jgi:hypothetical protein